MEAKYDVVFSGQLKAGADRARVVSEFSQRFGYQEDEIAVIFDSNMPVVLKRNVSRDTGQKFQQMLETLGMIVVLKPAIASAELSLEPLDEPPVTSPVDTAQATGNKNYQHQPPHQLQAPASLDAGRGMAWISDGYNRHVKKDMGPWIGAVVIYVLLYVLVSLVPLLGGLAAMLLAPVFVGGFMLGASAQDAGEHFSINHLLSGFNQNGGQLVLVGLLYLAGATVIGVLLALLLGGTMLMAVGLDSNPDALAAMISNPGVILLPLLLVLLLILPLIMAYWFAPALVVLDGLPAFDAMKQSFLGCLKNMLPMLVYSIVVCLLGILAAIPIFLGFLILAPVIIASLYVSYRDIFHQGNKDYSAGQG